ncbi:MAG: hypothetical protein ACYCZR_15200 [Burkholderiales bacterium]
MTLQEFTRALAAHAMLTTYKHELDGFFAPEKAERVAEFIHRFALGEAVDRPKERAD